MPAKDGESKMFTCNTLFNFSASRAHFELSGNWLPYRVPVELIMGAILCHLYLPQGTWQEGEMLK